MINVTKDKKNKMIVIATAFLYAAITCLPIPNKNVNLFSRSFFRIWFSSALVIECISEF